MAHFTEQDESKQPGLKLQALEAVLIAIVLLLQYLLWIAGDGVRQTYSLRVSIQAQTEENAELTERNQALEADIKDLKNGLTAIEERARTEMGMIRPDETFYRILEQPLPNPAAESSKPSLSTAKRPAATTKPLAQPTKRPMHPVKRPAAKPAPSSAKPPADDAIPD
ncbi:MAG: cell division protein FtsB [Candidatus Competibacteraceae bacterium]|nr:MAG: cell division protein FtsB [Candidatus Competibacteraceae bacterium]